jgi:hypothetical protein
MLCGTVIGDGDRDAAQLVLNLDGQRVERSAHGRLKVGLGMDRHVSRKVWAGVRLEARSSSFARLSTLSSSASKDFSSIVFDVFV